MKKRVNDRNFKCTICVRSLKKNPALDFKSQLKHAGFSFTIQHRGGIEIWKIMKQNRNATPPYSLYSTSSQIRKHINEM